MLAAFETMHYITHKRTGKGGYYVMKLDMMKAFDRVEWHFTEAVMS